MELKLDSITGALENKTVQSLGGFLWYGQKEYGDGAINGSIRAVEALFKDPHIPNFRHVFLDLKDTGMLKDLILLGLGGWIAEEINIHPMATKIGRLVKGFAMNGGLGAVIGSLVNHAGIEHSDGGAPGQPYGGHNGYPRGAGYSPLGRRNGGYFTMPTVHPSTPTIGAVLPASPRP